MKTIKYKRKWDYVIEYHTIILDDDNYIGNYEIEESENYFLLNTFYINPDYRNKGYGRKLLKLFIDEVKERHFNEVQLAVKIDNKYAIKLYEEVGFKSYKFCDRGHYQWMKLKIKINK